MRSVGLIVGIVVLASLARAQAPIVNAGGVVNNGSYSSQGVAPGSIVAIFGTNLASKLAINDTIPISTTLDTVSSITFNGVTAGLYFVGPTQIDAQLPFESLPANATSATVNIVVTTNTGSSAAQTVNVVPALPGIFTVSQNGLGQAIATDSFDNAIVAPAGSIAGLTTHPFSLASVSAGHAVVIWCTGLGAVNPPIADGANSYNADGSLTIRNTVLTPTVTIGGVAAQVVGSVLSPQYVSEYQIGVVPGPTTPTGSAVPVVITMNGVTTSSQVTIAVAP